MEVDLLVDKVEHERVSFPRPNRETLRARKNEARNATTLVLDHHNHHTNFSRAKWLIIIGAAIIISSNKSYSIDCCVHLLGIAFHFVPLG